MPPRPERLPVWVFVLTFISACGGLALNNLVVGDPEAFTLALLTASVAIGAVAWRVRGKEAQRPSGLLSLC